MLYVVLYGNFYEESLILGVFDNKQLAEKEIDELKNKQGKFTSNYYDIHEFELNKSKDEEEL